LGILVRAEERKETVLQRSFSAFPDGWPGVALLLLRVVVATALSIQGSYYLREPDLSTAAWFVGLGALASSVLFLAGFLTPVAGIVVALASIGSRLSFFPACTRNLFDSYLSVVFALAILFAVIILGPGAFSVDALLFGHREIIIPQYSSARRSLIRNL
jgi:putative oxidoreductase